MLSSIMDNMNAVVRAALIERLENDKKFGDYWALIFHHKAMTWNFISDPDNITKTLGTYWTNSLFMILSASIWTSRSFVMNIVL